MPNIENRKGKVPTVRGTSPQATLLQLKSRSQQKKATKHRVRKHPKNAEARKRTDADGSMDKRPRRPRRGWGDYQ